MTTYRLTDILKFNGTIELESSVAKKIAVIVSMSSLGMLLSPIKSVDVLVD